MRTAWGDVTMVRMTHGQTNDQITEPEAHSGTWDNAAIFKFIQDCIVARASTHPKQTALIHEGVSVSYAELATLVARIEEAFTMRGISHGDRVLSTLDCGPHFIALLFACLRTGVVLAPLSTGVDDGAVRDFVRMVEPKAILVESKCSAQLAGAVEAMVVGIDELKEGEGLPLVRSRNMQSEDACLIVFTSGSTGAPKGTLLPARSLAHAWHALSEGLHCTSDDVFLNALPVCHLFSLNAGIILPITMGARVVVMSRFSATAALDLMEAEGVSVFSGVPTMFKRLACEQQVRPRNLSAMRTGYVGGADCTNIEECETVLHVALKVLYGMTESPIIAIGSASAREGDGTCIGAMVDEVAIRFDCSTDAEADGAIGEILCKSPGTMLGYFRNSEKTQEKLCSDGWIRTGDIGYLDEYGRLHVSGRKDDVINRGGYKIFPAEVEAVCARYPGMEECCVMGMPHKELGKQIVVFAAHNEHDGLTSTELRSFARKHLSAHKLPDQTILVSEMPHLRNGKIDKAALRLLYERSSSTFASDAERLARSA